ncbi:unnamed protein product [Nippostrongylus brasiliensis]|uniref:MADF domain-containing protein n=1 Tax=Nippostrongylus brasiliensis TaxID=27835 RepID=A0A0N4XTK9_NIPBR|nr:unnamed protein product [Nippostrongylus brasiliensis]
MLGKRVKMDVAILDVEARFALIDLVQNYPELSEERHVFYKDQTKKDQSWHTVRLEMEEVYQKKYEGMMLGSQLLTLHDINHTRCETSMVKMNEVMLYIGKAICKGTSGNPFG